ncbi:hypothetical protein BGZ82_011677 [Podila clonocystis]|nr:hypothetical protein BGZ82_011677 [Podila clonocystis]
MIACDGCDDWFHGDCVGVAEKDSELVDKYYCKRCEDKGNHGSRKKKCSREECSKATARKSKYCSRECGLLVATERIRKSQERVFGGMAETNSSTTASAQDSSSMDNSKAHLQRRRRLTLADLDDRQRLLSIREKMAQVRKVCSILDDREKQLEVCVDRQTRQDLGEYRFSASSLLATIAGVSPATLSPSSSSLLDKEDSAKNGKSKGAKTQGNDKGKDKDKEALCGFDYSLVWDDAEDMSRIEKVASSVNATPAGSRASSVAPPSFGVVVFNSKSGDTSSTGGGGVSTKKQDQGPSSSSDAGGTTNGISSSLLLQMQIIGHRVCMSRKNCDRHLGWQKLKAAELALEKTHQSKLLKSLKVEAKLVKSRMRRRRTDLSAGILNGTIEH